MSALRPLIHVSFSLLFLVVCSACVSRNAEDSEPRDRTEVRNDLTAVHNRLNTYIAEHQLMNDPEIVAAVNVFRQLTAELQQNLKDHPEMRPLIREGQEFMRQAALAGEAGNEEAYQELIQKVQASRSRIEAKASEYPDFRKAEREIQKAYLSVSLAMAEVAAQTDKEGRKLATQFYGLLEELQ